MKFSGGLLLAESAVSFNVTSWNMAVGDDNPCPPQQIEKTLNVLGVAVPAIKDGQGNIVDPAKCYYPAISDDPATQHKSWTEAADSCATWLRGTANCPDCEGRLAAFHSSDQEMQGTTGCNAQFSLVHL